VYSVPSLKTAPARCVAFVVCAAVIAAPFPRSRASTRAASSADSVIVRTNTEYFLRDAVPSSGFASAPEDTTDPFLEEEKDTKTLVWEIAAWVVGAALVAFFIIKVFIEEDPDEPEDDGSDKPDPF
jgi:hypothetical protein